MFFSNVNGGPCVFAVRSGAQAERPTLVMRFEDWPARCGAERQRANEV